MNSIPKRLSFVHSFLSRQTWLLHLRWSVYAGVYLAKPSKRPRAYRLDPGLFEILNQPLLDSIALMFMKLLDPARHGPRTNATFDRLIRVTRSSRLRQRLDAALEPARSFAGAFRVRRHKQLAHYDLRVARGRYPKSWPNKSFDDFEAALDSLGAALNAVSEFYGQPPLNFQRIREPRS